MQRSSLVITAALLALSSSTAIAQPVEKGSLLAAAPNVTGFTFERSIVLVVHHDDNGSLGLIINRPTELRATETFDQLEGLDDYEGRVYVGGPLEPTRPLLLVNDTEDLLKTSEPVLGSIHVALNADVAHRYATRLTDEATMRVYAGHIQWEPGRLEAEISDGGWRVLPGNADTVFSEEPLELYRNIGTRDAELVAKQRAGGADTSSPP